MKPGSKPTDQRLDVKPMDKAKLKKERDTSMYDLEKKPLDAREFKAVQLHLSGKSNAEVGIESGSKSKTHSQAGWEILNRPNTKAAIADGQKASIRKSGLHSTEIVDILRLNLKLAQEKGDIKAANDSAKLLGQHLEGFFKAPEKSTDDPTDTDKSISKAAKVLGTSDETEDVRNDIKTFLNTSKDIAAGRGSFSDIRKVAKKITN